MREERKAYPIVISKEEDGFYYVSIPDFDIATQGESIADAMEMARDAIGIMGIDYLDDGKVLPEPNTKEVESGADDIVTLVDVDFAEYRKKVEKTSSNGCLFLYPKGPLAQLVRASGS